ncbi:hypothetical protein VTH06DRAFT_6165 [Thermothelomyces fergusii]
MTRPTLMDQTPWIVCWFSHHNNGPFRASSITSTQPSKHPKHSYQMFDVIFAPHYNKTPPDNTLQRRTPL